MREVGILEAANRLSELLDVVEQGEEVAIIRSGKRVARLVPDAVVPNRGRARQAVADIISQSRGVTLGGLRIKDLVNVDRS